MYEVNIYPDIVPPTTPPAVLAIIFIPVDDETISFETDVVSKLIDATRSIARPADINNSHMIIINLNVSLLPP
ncbi:MAG: hypothetical protein ACP5UL_05765 [Thermoplasmata archaeon]